MGKLTFCPYDGKKIELNNLAYELVFPDGWNWSRVKNDTVISDRQRAYIVEHDTKRQEHLAFADKESHVMLLASPEKGGKNGLTLLRRLVADGEPADVENVPKTSFEDTMKHLYGMKFSLNGQESTAAGQQFEDQGTVRKIRLHDSCAHGQYTFLDEKDDPVMYVLPCCPYCHNRLPVGWEEADGFAGISLLGPEGSGKTSFLYSLMHDRARNLEHPFRVAGETLTIRPAHFEMDEKDTIYAHVTREASRMCRENGTCPDSVAGNGYMPVFLRVQCGSGENSRTLIVGIYDNVSEYLDQIDTISAGSVQKLMEKLYADLYMFDPRDLQFQDIALKRISGQSHFVKCNVKSLEEQGDLQRNMAGQVIPAETVLAVCGEKRDNQEMAVETGSETMQLYEHLVSMYRRYGEEELLSKRCFLGVIAKNDLLRETLAESYGELLQQAPDTLEFDCGQIRQRSAMTKELLQACGVFGNLVFEKIGNDYGGDVSWHCISATGCDVVEHDHLLGEYKPVHVEDPIISCVVSWMRDKKWI